MTYRIDPPVDGVSVDPVTGVVSVETIQTREPRTVTVRQGNLAQSFDVTVALNDSATGEFPMMDRLRHIMWAFPFNGDFRFCDGFGGLRRENLTRAEVLALADELRRFAGEG